jgi:uncharacterized membrane protein YebE (DUF533 family)
MRELLILILIGGVAYLAYDDYYKQRPALLQAQAEVQQLRQNAASPVSRVWIPVTPTPPAWFQKHLNEGPAIEMSHQHTRQGEQATPRP